MTGTGAGAGAVISTVRWREGLGEDLAVARAAVVRGRHVPGRRGAGGPAGGHSVTVVVPPGA